MFKHRLGQNKSPITFPGHLAQTVPENSLLLSLNDKTKLRAFLPLTNDVDQERSLM